MRSGPPGGADPLAAHRIVDEPYYRPIGREVACYQQAYAHRLPVMLKGPTGCGKTRFVEHMAWRLGRPLVTVACHEDLSAGDLVGRFLLDGEGTVWHDGPLTLAARHGAILYLDEMIEARSDTTVVIHPLTDSRRMLPIDRTGELLRAHPDFQLVISYNPDHQQAAKRLKPSTRQRFVALDFEHPHEEAEITIVAHEGGVDEATARRLVQLAAGTRALRDQGLDEGASTRMLIRAAVLMRDGMAPREACDMAITLALSDDPRILPALARLAEARFG